MKFEAVFSKRRSQIFKSFERRFALTEATCGIGLFEFGGPEKLVPVTLPRRTLAPNQVRIRVAASAINPIDLLMREGAFADGMSIYEPPYVLGYDASGIIESVGSRVNRFLVGDEVMAVVSPFNFQSGAYQQELVIDEESVVSIPIKGKLAEAATLPMNALTAIASFRALALPAGSTVFVSGGAGWLATLILAIGKSKGLHMIADAAREDRASVLASGANDVIDRSCEAAAQLRYLIPDGVDAVIDTALIGHPLLSAIRDGGSRAIVRLETIPNTERGIQTVPISMMPLLRDTAALNEISELAKRGQLPMRIFARYEATDVAQAHCLQQKGGVRGRIILDFQSL